MNDFLRFADKLYANCPYYVPDLRMDIRETFDPRKNTGLEFSEIQPFIAYDAERNPVGRIAGIINHHANEKMFRVRCSTRWKSGAENAAWTAYRARWEFSTSIRRACW